MQEDETRDVDEVMLDEAESWVLMDEMDGASVTTDEDVEVLYANLAKLNQSLKD